MNPSPDQLDLARDASVRGTPQERLLADELIALVKSVIGLKHGGPRVSGCDPAAYPVLLTLLDGPRRVGDIAGCVRADVTVISRYGTALVTAGLASKSTDPQDRRAQLLSLTESGRSLALAIRAHRTRVLERALSGWTADEVDSLVAQLRRLRGALDSARAESLAPSPETTKEN